ncbi:MAG: DUF305 domain-containing protein [Pseudomonadota bacterium]
MRIHLAALALLLLATPAMAQHAGHGAPARAGAEAPSTREFRATNARMHTAMDIAFTGNTDRDFAAAMIPHHEAAIAMAETQLRHGTDPGMRRMAQAIIEAQAREIAELRAFLAR